MRSKRVEQVFEVARDGLLVLDRGRVVQANAAGRRMVGEASCDPEGWVAPNARAAWSRALEAGHGELEVELCSGGAATARLTPLPDGTLLVELQDASSRRALEERLCHDDHMRAVGQMASGIAHDMNNVLTVVSSIGSVMRSELRGGDPTVLEDIDDILSAARAGQDLTRNLLGFARRQVSTRVHLDVGAVATEVVDLVRRTAPPDARIDILPGDSVVVCADRSRLSQAIMNLVLNAIDAFEGDGGVEVHVEHVTRDADPSRPETRPAGAYAHIRVADDGPGMEAATSARCFEPFFTTKPPGKGTGLGLSMVRDTANRHRGWVDIETSPGNGTSIDLYLPAVPRREATPVPIRPVERNTPPPNPENPISRGRVLVVDDEKPIRRVARRLLRQLGFDPVSAPDGRAALELFLRAPETFTAVVCDVVMPVMDGPEVCNRLRRQRPELPVLVCSGLADYDHRGTFGTEATHFLPKPFDLNSLGDALDALLGA